MLSQPFTTLLRASCFEHEHCYNLEGSVFRFEASRENNLYVRLLVAKAGTCAGAVRQLREESAISER